MNMLGHYHVASDEPPVPAPHPLQRLLEDPARRRCGQKRLAAITTEGDEMQITTLLITLEPVRHERTIY
jgi:hypothetical protein